MGRINYNKVRMIILVKLLVKNLHDADNVETFKLNIFNKITNSIDKRYIM